MVPIRVWPPLARLRPVQPTACFVFKAMCLVSKAMCTSRMLVGFTVSLALQLLSPTTTSKSASFYLRWGSSLSSPPWICAWKRPTAFWLWHSRRSFAERVVLNYSTNDGSSSSSTAKSGEWRVVGKSFQNFCFLVPLGKLAKRGRKLETMSRFFLFPIPQSPSLSGWNSLAGLNTNYSFRTGNSFHFPCHLAFTMTWVTLKQQKKNNLPLHELH